MNRRRLLGAALAGLAVLALAAVFGTEILAAARAVFEWIDGLGVWGPAVYVAVSTVAIVLLVPAAPQFMAAGALFGLAAGTVYAFAAGAVAGSATFLISRYLARDLVKKKLSRHEALKALDRAVRREGLRAALLIRSSPIVPSSVLNYGLGLSALRFRDHLVASVAALPGTFLYVYYGKALGDLAALLRGGPEKGAGYYALLVGGIMATLLATRQLTVRARKILDSDDSNDPEDINE